VQSGLDAVADEQMGAGRILLPPDCSTPRQRRTRRECSVCETGAEAASDYSTGTRVLATYHGSLRSPCISERAGRETVADGCVRTLLVGR
jgi:hypothetical protein